MTKHSNLVTNHGYMKTADGIVPKPFRPTTIGAAKLQIMEVFERSRWDEDDQRRYFKMKSIEADKLDDIGPDDIRRILAEMEKSRMVVFQD